MKEEGSMLKIYASSTDRAGDNLLYETVVKMARDAGISGCTVYRGIMGYGTSSHITMSKFWEITEKLPVIIEIVDTTEKIDQFFTILEPVLHSMPKGCLAIKLPVAIMLKKKGAGRKS
jgi:uncharacterized protein